MEFSSISNWVIVMLQFYIDVVLSQMILEKLNLIFEMMRVVVIFPLSLVCVMPNGFSHAQF